MIQIESRSPYLGTPYPTISSIPNGVLKQLVRGWVSGIFQTKVERELASKFSGWTDFKILWGLLSFGRSKYIYVLYQYGSTKISKLTSLGIFEIYLSRPLLIPIILRWRHIRGLFTNETLILTTLAIWQMEKDNNI